VKRELSAVTDKLCYFSSAAAVGALISQKEEKRDETVTLLS
jgi:hypothetical protein